MSNATPKIEQIIESWIDLANQAMQHRDETLYHGYISANEDAIELLEQLGAVIKVTPADGNGQTAMGLPRKLQRRSRTLNGQSKIMLR